MAAFPEHEKGKPMLLEFGNEVWITTTLCAREVSNHLPWLGGAFMTPW